MTATSPVWAHQANAHNASVVRSAVAAAFGAPFASFAGGAQATTAAGAHGVIGSGDLAVSQHGTPNMSVDVAAGWCVIRGTEATAQGCYSGCGNTAALNLAIAASDPTNPRRDLVVAKVRDSEYSGSSDDFSIVVVTGTAASSPADPAIPNNALVLARVAVAANATAITTGNITDLRTHAATVGGILPCTSTTRPSGAAARDGQAIYEYDTNNFYVYDGTNWTPPHNVHGGTLGYAQRTTTATLLGPSVTDVSTLSVTATVPANRRIKVTAQGIIGDNSITGAITAELQIREGSTVLNKTQRHTEGDFQDGFLVVAILTPTAAAHTYKASVQVTSGTVSLQADATFPAFILVEDIGGV